MSTATPAPAAHERELLGQTVVIIGGSAGIGLETTRRARGEGAEVILTARDPARLKEGAREVGALGPRQDERRQHPAIHKRTGGRRIRPGLGVVAAATAALHPFTAALALELAPVRVNLIAAGFVDTPLSASLLGDGLDARRDDLRATLPSGRVVGPDDVAAIAVHIMTNTALTGATYDIDGGQQFVS
jgi:NAD(P)-dependent dehydrogenase (short-subunit alcohol dehydrogenase family)